MSKRELIEAEVEATNNRIEEIVSAIAQLKDDCDQYSDEFDAILDDDDMMIGSERNTAVVICGITFSRSRILKELDEVAYRTELLNYVDGLRTEDLKGFDELNTEQEELEAKLDDLKDELDENTCPECGEQTKVEMVDQEVGDVIVEEKCCTCCDWRE